MYFLCYYTLFYCDVQGKNVQYGIKYKKGYCILCVKNV